MSQSILEIEPSTTIEEVDITETVDNGIAVLGMVLLKQPDSLNLPMVLDELEKKWGGVEECNIDGSAAYLRFDGYMVVIVEMPYPIPDHEVESVAEYNYFWPNGVAESAQHQGHVIISIMTDGEREHVTENRIFSKIASAVLNHSDSSGVYLGDRTLALEKTFYQTNVEMMSEDELPLYLWIYFGLRQGEGKQSVYTYGLEAFSRKEIEIIDSALSFQELNEIVFDIIHYQLSQNIFLDSGETIGFNSEQKINITSSAGVYLPTETLKINL